MTGLGEGRPQKVGEEGVEDCLSLGDQGEVQLCLRMGPARRRAVVVQSLKADSREEGMRSEVRTMVAEERGVVTFWGSPSMKTKSSELGLVLRKEWAAKGVRRDILRWLRRGRRKRSEIKWVKGGNKKNRGWGKRKARGGSEEERGRRCLGLSASRWGAEGWTIEIGVAVKREERDREAALGGSTCKRGEEGTDMGESGSSPNKEAACRLRGVARGMWRQSPG
ncbi:hypothetical protein AMTR_s00080p00093800 [Amborella trichopoda]|uniref:Uncharacterized protein n=1 Tax=Amborella trichopoda TaxID=13333 RepID=W1PBC9_AMBTC|nr:hypothetical protein AMTR_s00080p00093800 [Amborella trichopoda]